MLEVEVLDIDLSCFKQRAVHFNQGSIGVDFANTL